MKVDGCFALTGTSLNCIRNNAACLKLLPEKYCKCNFAFCLGQFL